MLENETEDFEASANGNVTDAFAPRYMWHQMQYKPGRRAASNSYTSCVIVLKKYVTFQVAESRLVVHTTDAQV